MHFNRFFFFILLGFVFIISQSSQCNHRPKNEPGVTTIHVTVLDENNTPVPYAPVGLFKLPVENFEPSCLVDTFYTKSNGSTTYSFLNTDKNYFGVQVLPHQLSISPMSVFEDLGEFDASLQTTHAQPLINIHTNPSAFDSTLITVNITEYFTGSTCTNSLSLIPQYLDRQKVIDNSTEHSLLLQGIPNQNNFIRVTNYTDGTIADSTIYVLLDSTSISIEIN